MRKMMIYLTYLEKIPNLFKTALAHPFLLTPLIPLFMFENQTLAIVLLFAFIVIDYFTGVLASWIEAKKNKTSTKWFSSEKTRLSIIKTVSYMLFILGIWAIDKIFLIKKFSFSNYSDAQFTITLFSISICICIEFYSIFWENLPKSGIDIPGYFMKIVKKFLTIKKDLQNDNNNPQ